MIVKIAFLVSYDYEYLKYSLPCIYDSDRIQDIFLVIDKNKLTWSGNSFDIADDFYCWLKEIDTKKKIKLIETNFNSPDNHPMMNENLTRNFVNNEIMSDCDWFIQIDCDEYFYDFELFLDDLENIYKSENYSRNISVRVALANLFKKIDDGFLAISPIIEKCWVATSNRHLYYGRVNPNNKIIDLDYLILHQSWARSNEEIYDKISNWGHKEDFNTFSYYSMWSILDKFNYKYINNFHPLKDNDGVWESLKFIKTDAIEDLLKLNTLQIKRLFNSQIKIKFS